MKIYALVLCDHAWPELLTVGFSLAEVTKNAEMALAQARDHRNNQQAEWIGWALRNFTDTTPDGFYHLDGKHYDEEAERKGFVNWPAFHLLIASWLLHTKVTASGEKGPPICPVHGCTLQEWSIMFSESAAVVRGFCVEGCHEICENLPAHNPI